jgi:hypothetical protein
MMLRVCSKLLALALFLVIAPRTRAQGPPYQTDDPVPVDYGHYEFYIFGTADGTPVEMDTTGPAVEFNWGAIPRIQLHAILPLGSIMPSNNRAYLPAGTGPSAFGPIDAETGIKWAWIKETKHIPQVGTFTMFELPLGSYSKGLGVGKVWYRVPLWAQKNIGPWTLDGGAGETIVPQSQYKNFPYGGFLLKRDIIHNKLELGAEVFSHGAEGIATPQIRGSTMIDVGGYYHFKNPDHQFLFAYGHSISGLTENYAYIGIYWTWGKDKDNKGSGSSSLPLSPAFTPPMQPYLGVTSF